MIQDKDIEQRVRDVMLDLMITLSRHGINTVPVGAVMRIMGVPNEVAEQHDDEYVESNEAVLEGLEEIGDLSILVEVPPGTKFH